MYLSRSLWFACSSRDRFFMFPLIRSFAFLSLSSIVYIIVSFFYRIFLFSSFCVCLSFSSDCENLFWEAKRAYYLSSRGDVCKTC